MFGLKSRFALRVSSIQRKVSAQARRQGSSGGSGSSFRTLNAKLSQARKQVARRGH